MKKNKAKMEKQQAEKLKRQSNKAEENLKRPRQNEMEEPKISKIFHYNEKQQQDNTKGNTGKYSKNPSVEYDY